MPMPVLFETVLPEIWAPAPALMPMPVLFETVLPEMWLAKPPVMPTPVLPVTTQLVTVDESTIEIPLPFADEMQSRMMLELPRRNPHVALLVAVQPVM